MLDTRLHADAPTGSAIRALEAHLLGETDWIAADRLCRLCDLTLEALVEGVKSAKDVDKKFKFLRRMPVDPFTNTRDWGKRSMQDDNKSTSWGGQHVFNVYSKTLEKAPDGTPYSEW